MRRRYTCADCGGDGYVLGPLETKLVAILEAHNELISTVQLAERVGSGKGATLNSLNALKEMDFVACVNQNPFGTKKAYHWKIKK